MKNLILIGIFLMTSIGVTAQQFSYQPINPAFGGDTFNYNWLISSATAQNGLTARQDARDDQSDLERFGENLQSQILSQISRTLTAQQISSIGDLTEPGSFTFGNLAVEVFESDEGLVVNILDILTGEETQVIVPN